MNQWINIRDELPSMFQRCLVYRGVDFGQSVEYFLGVTLGIAVFEGDYRGDDLVTHWMPLPKDPY